MSKRWNTFEKTCVVLAILTLLVGFLTWVTTRSTRETGNATTTGPNSPAVTGDNNKTEIKNDTSTSDSKTRVKEAPKSSAKDKP